MDKEKFIKRAREYEYSDEEINEMIQDYENDLKNGIDIDPIIFLIDRRGVVQTSFSPIPPELLMPNN
jgi:hypothetical protein